MRRTMEEVHNEVLSGNIHAFYVSREWKEKNKEYIRELERFLDRSDAIKDESTRLAIVAQMLKCDEVLTKICEEKLLESYNEGYKKGENAHNTL